MADNINETSLMKKSILIVLSAAVMPLLACGAAPGFGGSWLLDEANSDALPHPNYWLTRGVGTRSDAEPLMTVTMDGKNLEITREARMSDNYISYMLDGKPHSQPMDTGMAQETVTAQVDGDKLVVVTSQPYGGMPGNATMDTREEWSLSADGSTLTIVTSRDLSGIKQTFTQVYNRQ